MQGEIKKSMFSVLNYLLPDKGILPMHAGANEGDKKKIRQFSCFPEQERQLFQQMMEDSLLEMMNTLSTMKAFSTLKVVATQKLTTFLKLLNQVYGKLPTGLEACLKMSSSIKKHLKWILTTKAFPKMVDQVTL